MSTGDPPTPHWSDYGLPSISLKTFSSLLGMAITLKLPKFNTRDPQLLFVMVKNDFKWARPQITDEHTKWSYMVRALDDDIANRVREILMKPPTSDPLHMPQRTPPGLL